MNNKKIPYVNLFACNKDLETSSSPAVIATACAGISHQMKNFQELRKKYQNLDELINLDKKLIEMGHKSIAEHMFFNFDVELTRLGVEFLEMHRLVSYTEKSQRFTVVKPDAFFIPKELEKISEVGDLIKEQVNLYGKALKKIRNDILKKKYGAEWKKYDGKAKENARYCLSLIVTAPLNFSVNGRELEYIICKANSNELHEIRKFGKRLDNELKKKVPEVNHLLKYTSKDNYYSENRKLKDFISGIGFEKNKNFYIEFEKNIDEKIIAAILFKNSETNYDVCLKKAKKMNLQNKGKIIKLSLQDMEKWHDAPREWENAYVRFSKPISASCFAQLKRHRIMTLLSQDYDPNLGYYFPEIIEEIGLKEEYKKVYDKDSELMIKLKKAGNSGWQYLTTNGHMKNVYVVMNFRELYHFSRLRQDIHAQDEIRFDTANPLCNFFKDRSIAGILLGGKHEFEKTKKEIYKNGK